MWLNQDSLARSLTHATSTPEVPSTYIHPFLSPEPPKNILLLIRERMAKNISIFPFWNKCSSYLVTTTCYIISWDECSKKIIYEEIKRGPESRKKRKSETRGKNGQVSDTRIRSTRYPPERKRKYRASHSLHKVSKSKEGMYPLKRANVELDFYHCYHHHHHTPFIRHTWTSWFDLLICFFGSIVWLYNKCLASMYTLSPTYVLQILKPY